MSGGTLAITAGFSDSSTVALAGGTLACAQVAANTTLQAGNGTLTGVTLAGTLNFVGQGFPTVNASALTLAGGTINFFWFGASLDFSGTQTLGGTGTVEFADGGNINATGSGGLLTIGSGITVQCIGNAQPAFLNAGSSTIDNQGIINANDANANYGITLESGTGSWKNDGTVEATNGGSLTLTGNWTNNADGSIAVTGSTLNLSGTWSNAGTFTSQGASSVNLGGTFGLANLGNYTRDAAGKDTFNVVGTLNLAGQTLNASAGPGLWKVENGTIENGTIGGGVTFDTVGTNTSTLQSVTLAGTLNFIGQGIPTVNASALTLAGGTIDFPWFDANLDFSGTQTLGGTGTVEFANGGNN